MDPTLPSDDHARMQQYFSSFSEGGIYNPQMSPYEVVQQQQQQQQHTGRPLAVSDLQQGPGMHQYHHQNMHHFPSHSYQPGGMYPSSPPHGLPISGTPPPPSPDLYDPPLSPPISGSDTSADGFYHHSNHSNSSANSVTSSRSSSLVHRHPIRYNPTPSPTSSSGRPFHRRGHSQDSDDEDNIRHVDLAHTRKEATRRQRIEAEQKRRDELRVGYAKLKEVLPISSQKSSKVNLLERATNRITQLEKDNHDLQSRVDALHEEIARLQALNEKISLGGGSVGAPSPGRFNVRPLSPPPEPQNHITASGTTRSHDSPSNASTPSASDNGY